MRLSKTPRLEQAEDRYATELLVLPQAEFGTMSDIPSFASPGEDKVRVGCAETELRLYDTLCSDSVDPDIVMYILALYVGVAVATKGVPNLSGITVVCKQIVSVPRASRSLSKTDAEKANQLGIQVVYLLEAWHRRAGHNASRETLGVVNEVICNVERLIESDTTVQQLHTLIMESATWVSSVHTHGTTYGKMVEIYSGHDSETRSFIVDTRQWRNA